MTTTYHIQGMTCNGCRSSVEQKLAAVAGVTKAEVSLEAQQAVITSELPIPEGILRAALPEKYTLSTIVPPANTAKTNTTTASTEPSKWQQLKPLFLILFYIATASVLLHLDTGAWRDMMLDFMGLFLIVFSFFKMLDLRGFPASFRMYDPLAKAVPFYAQLYPFLEVALGLMFLFRYEVKIALVVSMILLGITTIGVTRSLLSKKSIRCACLGTALNLPMTEATFIENAIMLAMGVVMLMQMV